MDISEVYEVAQLGKFLDHFSEGASLIGIGDLRDLAELGAGDRDPNLTVAHRSVLRLEQLDVSRLSVALTYATEPDLLGDIEMNQ